MEVFKCVQCFIGFWKDFQADQKWRFTELPPSQFEKWLELSRPGVDFAEFERAKWFWERRPSLILDEGLPGYLLVRPVTGSLPTDWSQRIACSVFRSGNAVNRTVIVTELGELLLH